MAGGTLCVTVYLEERWLYWRKIKKDYNTEDQECVHCTAVSIYQRKKVQSCKVQKHVREYPPTQLFLGELYYPSPLKMIAWEAS